MNPFCPYDNRLLKTTKQRYKCNYCGSWWKKGVAIMKQHETDPILWLRGLFK